MATVSYEAAERKQPLSEPLPEKFLHDRHLRGVLPTPRNRVPLQNLIVLYLFKELCVLYRTRILRYRVHNSLQLDNILSQMNLVHTATFYSSKTHFNIILPSTAMSPKKSISFRFSNQSFVFISHLLKAQYLPHNLAPTL